MEAFPIESARLVPVKDEPSFGFLALALTLPLGRVEEVPPGTPLLEICLEDRFFCSTTPEESAFSLF